MSASQAAAQDPLLAYRSLFPILDRTTYLISNSLGAVPSGAYESVHEYVDLWATRGVRAWEDAWWNMPLSLGNLVAPLIGAGENEVVFQPCVTIAHAVIFSAFDYQAGRPRIVTDAMHFPSILYLIAEQRSRHAEITVVPAADSVSVDTERIVDAIDERTAFVSLSHVLFKSAYIHDVAAICARARSVGAVTIIDGYQAVGTIPLDVKNLGVDVYVGGCLKWLCGGPGAAFLWVQPDLRSHLTPRLTGWMSHEQPFDFSPQLERRSDAWRFLNGTPSIPALYAARPGLEIINKVGVPAIRAKSMRQTARILELAESRNLRCTTPTEPARRGGTVAIDVAHGYEASQALKQRDVLCDYRPGAGIRFSPHFYNNDAELDHAVNTLAEVLESRAWQPFAQRHSVVT